MGRFVAFALMFLISTEIRAQAVDRYEFHAKAPELANRIWSFHGVAVDTREDTAWWCVYSINLRTIVTRLECLRRSAPSTDMPPGGPGSAWIPAARGTTPPPNVVWSMESATGFLKACISITEKTCKTVQLKPFPRLLEAVDPKQL